jgi:DNA-binding transcriptional MerR regulator
MKAKTELKDQGISAAAGKVPCAEGTLRRLDRRGIIHPMRDSAGRRLFGENDIAAARDYLARARASATV